MDIFEHMSYVGTHGTNRRLVDTISCSVTGEYDLMVFAEHEHELVIYRLDCLHTKQ